MNLFTTIIGGPNCPCHKQEEQKDGPIWKKLREDWEQKHKEINKDLSKEEDKKED